MPRHVRNFWIELDIAGRRPFASGPRSAGGGFAGVIKVRHKGDIITGARLCGDVCDGRIVLTLAAGRDWGSAVTVNAEAGEIRIETTR